MSKYELCVVVNAQIEDDARTAVVDNCKALVERFGGEITNVDDWGKRRLAYLINDEAEGYYVFFTFESEPSFPAELERIAKITDGVLRAMVIKK